MAEAPVRSAATISGASAQAGERPPATRADCHVCNGSGVPHGAMDGGGSWHCPHCGTSCVWPAWLQIGHAALSGTLMLTFWWIAL